jgi:hypothetical protein
MFGNSARTRARETGVVDKRCFANGDRCGTLKRLIRLVGGTTISRVYRDDHGLNLSYGVISCGCGSMSMAISTNIVPPAPLAFLLHVQSLIVVHFW